MSHWPRNPCHLALASQTEKRKKVQVAVAPSTGQAVLKVPESTPAQAATSNLKGGARVTHYDSEA
eukprot:2002024-Pleurochrysis_carterae.AAC.6